MKPSQLFVNSEDFSNRFKDTFIYYKGVPKYVHQCTLMKAGDMESLAFLAYDFDGVLNLEVEPQVIFLNSEDVNFRDYNLGYNQVSATSAVWIARAPMRQWKQGLRRDQCQGAGFLSDNDSMSDYLAPMANTYQMLMNAYPSPEAAIIRIQNQPLNRTLKIAIHKNFAILRFNSSRSFVIEYKGSIITERVDGNYTNKISPEYRYLLDIPEYSKLLNGARNR